MSLLEVRALTIAYGPERVVDGLDFSVGHGESVGLVGESGSGKSQTALAILGLLPANAHATGSIRFDGRELAGATAQELDGVRATRIGIVFQDPLQALNPYLRIGRQLELIVTRHRLARGRAVRERVLGMLTAVGLPDPARQARAFPHQLSGGMRQRVMIAAALIGEPDLLIADEPTTALDVTVQAQVLELLQRLRQDTALLLITHDLGIVAGHCDRVIVLDKGRPVETGQTREVFNAPASVVTRRLLDAVPRLDAPPPVAPAAGVALLLARGLSSAYHEPGHGALHAVRNVDLEVAPGETLAIVGESGSGKSSLVRTILGLVPADAGTVVFDGVSLPAELRQRARSVRRDLQLVFQDPVASLNPQMTVGEIVAEPLYVGGDMNRDARRRRVTEMLEQVGLGAAFVARHAHELSGGQAQRVAIARALVVEPRVLVCDEAVAALDGTVRGQILGLLQDAQRRTGLSILFIAHDLAVVRQICHRVMVMYLGRVVEIADNESLFDSPRHPYTRALIDAVPALDGRRPPVLRGEIPSLLTPPRGCAFHPRCRYAEAACRDSRPPLRDFRGGRVACLRAETLQMGTVTWTQSR